MSSPLVTYNIPPKPDEEYLKTLPVADTPEQIESVLKFREYIDEKYPAVKDCAYFSNRTLLLFLTARKFDFEKAGEMVNVSHQWRIANDIDTLLDTFTPPKYINGIYMPGGAFGQDKDGDLVVYSRLGLVDPSGICNGFPSDFVRKVAAWRQELLVRRLDTRSCEEKRPFRRLFVITDLAGLGMRQCVPSAFSLLGSVLRIQEDHYPERLKTNVIIRAPSIFQYAWGIASKYLDERTRAKFVFAGPDHLSVLRQYIDDEQIPAMYGGSAIVDGDPECRTRIPACGAMLPEHILSDRLEIDDQVHVNVRAGSSHLHHFDAPEGGHLRWVFQTDAHDIDFAVRQGSSVIHGTGRVSAAREAVSGSVAVDPGKFTFVFDNSFSWTRSKQVSYRVWLDPATTEVDVSLSELSLAGGNGNTAVTESSN